MTSLKLQSFVNANAEGKIQDASVNANFVEQIYRNPNNKNSMKMHVYRKYNVQQLQDVTTASGLSVSVRRNNESGDDSSRKAVVTVSVEEQVMEWNDASHIHAWFVKNVQGGKNDYSRYVVSSYQIMSLLEVCEKVLNASKLVREPAYTVSSHNEVIRERKASGSSLTMKSVDVAHKLLPIRSEYSSGIQDYNEQYVKDVEATRDWAERMLLESQLDNVEIYYKSSRW